MKPGVVTAAALEATGDLLYLDHRTGGAVLTCSHVDVTEGSSWWVVGYGKPTPSAQAAGGCGTPNAVYYRCLGALL